MSSIWKKAPLAGLLLALACHWRSALDLGNSTVEVTPSTPVLARGTSLQLQATEVLGDATTRDVTANVTWSSSDPAIATFGDPSDPGRVLASAVGTVTLRATMPSNGSFGEVQLLVTDATLVGIDVTPASLAIPLGLSRSFTAIGMFSDNSTQDLTSDVEWSSSDAAVAAIGNGSGTKGFATTLSVGQTTLTATSVALAMSGSTTLTVTGAQLAAIALTPPSSSVALGRTQQFTAMGTFTDSSVQDVTAAVVWSSNAPGVATVSNAVGSQGLATSVAVGSATITATHPATGILASTGFGVTSAELVSIGVTPSALTVPVGLQQQFTAMGTYTDSTVVDITNDCAWTTSAAAVATISNAIGSQGRATAIGIGNATITATQPSAGLSGTSALTVSAASLVSVAVTPTNPTIALGLTQQFQATGTYTDNTTNDLTDAVTWTSSATGVATVSNAPGTRGRATAVGTGATSITATHPASGLSANTGLTVSAAALVSLAVAPTSPTIALGLEQAFTATGTYTDASVQDLTTAVTWSSSATSVATISNAPGTEGRATSAAIGTTTIAAFHAGSGLSASTDLTVSAATLVSIAILPAADTAALGLDRQFTATGTFTDNSTQDLTQSVTWASSSTGVATISNAVGSKGLATTVGVGSTTISATQPVAGTTANTSFTVTAAELVSIAVTPANPSVVAGQTQQFTATGTYTDSSTANLTTAVTWSSSATSFATVSNAAGSNGLATAIDAGNATITATDPATSIAAGTTLTVTQAPPVATASPQVTGATYAGLTLTSTTGTWTANPTGFAYQWQVDGADIVGATANTFTMTSAQEGRAMRCVVTASNAGGSGASTSAAVDNWVPADLGASLAAWYDANDTASLTLATANVQQWNDKTGNAAHLSQVSATNQPVYDAVGLNARPAVVADGIDDVLETGPFVVDDPLSIYAVARNSGGGGTQRLVSALPDFRLFFGAEASSFATYFGDGVAWNDALANTPLVAITTPSILGMVNGGGTAVPYVNGTPQDPKTGTMDPAQSIALFGPGQPWGGPVGEVVIVGAALSAADRERLEGYLAHKWGLTGSLPPAHPYAGAAP